MNKINKYIILYFCFTIHLKLIIEMVKIIKLNKNFKIIKKRIKKNKKGFIRKIKKRKNI